MPELVLHPTTKLELEQFARRPSHAVMLVGSEGIGKMAVVRQLATELLRLQTTEALERYPYFRTVAPDGQAISIDTVRDLLNFTKLKIAGNEQGIQRIIAIDEAHTMTSEAQNALLKLLEEPPEGTAFLLTVSNAHVLLPTIHSRTQQVTIKQPTREDLEAYFVTQGFDAPKIQSAYLMSGGLPGLMHALLHESEDHPLTKAVTQARNLLRVSTFERLAIVDSLSKQKQESMRLLFVLQQMAHVAVTQSAAKGANNQSIKQWQRILSAAYDAENGLRSAAQPKLVLTNLMLSL